MAYLSGYTKRKKITISNTNVISDLTNFPVMVKFTNDSDIGGVARSDGYDVRFTSSDGTTLLDYERELFSISSGNASGIFWVCVPTVASAASTDIYMYFGKADASTDVSVTTFWDADYSNIYHFGEAGSGLNDSSANGNHLTNGGLTISGGKATCSGDDNASASFESDFSSSTTRMMSALASTAGGTGRRCIIGFSLHQNDFEPNLGHRYLGDDNALSVEVGRGGVDTGGIDSDFTITTNVPYHIAAIYKDTGEVDLYVNGTYNTSYTYPTYITSANKVWNWTYPAVLTDGTDYVTFSWGVNSSTHYFGITNLDDNLDELFGAGNWSKTDVYGGGSGAGGGSWDITLIGSLQKSPQDTPTVAAEVVTGGGNNVTSEVTAGSDAATTLDSSGDSLIIGSEIYSGSPDYFFNGDIYEARYSLIARSAAWIKFEANNLLNGETTFSALESSSVVSSFKPRTMVVC